MKDVPSPPSSSVLHGRYELGLVLGHGTFAKVHVARDLRSGSSVAIKVVGKDKVLGAGMMEQVKRKISVMKLVSHPNIVAIHEIMATKSKIYFAMELVRGGELFSLVARGGRLPESTARHYLRQLVSAVDFCHSRGVYHRDLKLENLLLGDDGELKVADFCLSAFAEHVRHDGLLHTTCGSPAYIAPEVIGKKGYDGAKADLWSCGVILYVLSGFLPFQDDNLVAMYGRIHRGDFRCAPWFSSDTRRVITKPLDLNPSTRMTVSKLVEMPWFKKSSMPRSPAAPAQGKKEREEPERLNAFHLISLSEGFDLSPLFEDGERKKDEGMRFATREPPSGVVARLESVAERAPGKYRVVKNGAKGVRLEGVKHGRKGRLEVAGDIFAVAPSVLVVEVRKDGGALSSTAVSAATSSGPLCKTLSGAPAMDIRRPLENPSPYVYKGVDNCKLEQMHCGRLCFNCRLCSLEWLAKVVCRCRQKLYQRPCLFGKIFKF